MPRRPRHYLPGLPYHVVQRGNNKNPCFFDSDDYALYLNLWMAIVRRYGVDVHAYCLMTNHIHFLLTPHSATAISDTMRVVGSSYAQYINKKYERTGTLWEGRHHASLVQSNRYLLTCYRYIELNPVRAKMVEVPRQYAWSSHAANTRGELSWLTPHSVYLALGIDKSQRASNYRKQFSTELHADELSLFRKAARYCLPAGDDAFRQEISAKFGITFGQDRPGRPGLVKK